jgi:ADP-ribose pyrophosphatase YjhB (NUDIX family)
LKIREAQKGVIEASGGVVWRKGKNGKQLALVHRVRYDDWSLPKGWLKSDETWQEAAIREVKEETGCQAHILGLAGCSWYLVDGIPKVVLFWHMELVEEGPLRRNDETDEVIWMSLGRAIDTMSYEAEKEIVRAAAAEQGF